MALPHVRDAFNFSQGEFEALWDSVGDYLLIEVYDNSSRPQGTAVVKVTQKYKPDRDGAFFLCQYLGCSDPYYAYWVANDMDPDPFHHLCRHSIRTCRSKVGRDQIVHVLRWNPISQKESVSILKSWGIPERAPLKRKIKPVEEHPPNTSSKAKPAPPQRSRGRSPVRSTGDDRHEKSKGGSDRRKKPATKKEKEPSSEYEYTYTEVSADEEIDPEEKIKKPVDKGASSVVAEDGRRRHHHGGGSKRKSALVGAKPVKTKKKESSALDAVIDEDVAMLDPNSEAVKKAEARLSKLRDDLKSRREAQSSGSTPGEILAARASSVKVEKKRKPRDKDEKLVKLLKSAGSKKRSRSESSDPSDSSEEDSRLIGGRSDFAKKQRRLKELSSRKPGVLMSRGFALMHEQLGTIFDGGGHHEEEASILTPVATRYLLSVVVPQLGEDAIGNEKMRELRTAAHCLDLLVQGKTAQAGDLMTQRLKALLMTLRDKSDLASRYLELIAFETFPGATTSMETDYARTLAVKAAKSEELLKKAAV